MLAKDSFSALNSAFDVCVMGQPQCGKSSLVCAYVYGKYIEDIDSVEELYTKKLKTSQFDELTILDTSSESDIYTSSRKKQIANTGSFVFAYSIGDRQTFERLDDLIDNVIAVRGELPPFVIVGLKSDLEQSRQVAFDEGQALAERWGARYFTEASALVGQNVLVVFDKLVEVILEPKRAKIAEMKSQETSRAATPFKEPKLEPEQKEEAVERTSSRVKSEGKEKTGCCIIT